MDLAASRARDRESLRAELVARIPRWYSPWQHLCFTTGLGVAFSSLALSRLHRLSPWQLLTVPIVWVISNASEWRAHRDWLHKPAPGLRVAYRRHALEHHQLYLTEDMEIRSFRELYHVMMPSWAIALAFLGTLPLAAALWLLGWHNVAALFVATTQFYVVSYEWFHLCYHLPRASWVGRLRVVRLLARHHAIHHHPERMARWNMNVNVPLWDWVRGTIYEPGVSGPEPVFGEGEPSRV